MSELELSLSSSELAVVVPGWGWVAVQAVEGKFRYMSSDHTQQSTYVQCAKLLPA